MIIFYWLDEQSLVLTAKGILSTGKAFVDGFGFSPRHEFSKALCPGPIVFFALKNEDLIYLEGADNQIIDL